MALERVLLDRTAALAEAIGAAGELGSASDSVLIDSLRLLGDVKRAADALGARLAAEVAVRSEGDASLAKRLAESSATVLVARQVGIEPAEASDWCVAGAAATPTTNLQGQQLPLRFPGLATAISEGAIAIAGARRIADTLEKVAATSDSDTVCALESVLVGYAPTLTGRELRKLCSQAVDRADPDGAEPREDELRRRSGIRVINGRDGLITWIVTMHPEAAGFLTTAVDARTAPRRQPTFRPDDELDLLIEHDDRTLAQQRLDALVSIGRDSLLRDDGDVAGTAVTMVVNIDYDTLVSGIGAATIDGIDTPISAATARRLACDAEVLPRVFGGPSEKLDLGRTERLFSRAQRRAIAYRDGGCTWPGCTAPPGWCEVAHIVAWLLGGPTDLDNGILLCPFHHRRFDRDGWGFEWRDGMPWFIPPPWLDSTGSPRRGGRLRLAA
jgi:hypothetical protein